MAECRLNSKLRSSGRCFSFAEREEIAILHSQRCGIRQIAHQIGRAASTISRELRRNAATRFTTSNKKGFEMIRTQIGRKEFTTFPANSPRLWSREVSDKDLTLVKRFVVFF